LKLVHDLRAAGFAVEFSLTAFKPDKQLKRAQELKAAHTVRFENHPTAGLLLKVRNLKTRHENMGSPADAAAMLRRDS